MVYVEVTGHALIQSICASGHAGFANYGQDVVCAGISSILIGALNALDVMVADQVELEMSQDMISIHVKSKDEIVQKLLQFCLIQLETIKEQYPSHITIKRKEV